MFSDVSSVMFIALAFLMVSAAVTSDCEYGSTGVWSELLAK